MKEPDENYHYTIWAICNQCLTDNPSDNFDKFEQNQFKHRMQNYGLSFNKFRFECPKCHKLLQIEVKELEEDEKWT